MNNYFIIRGITMNTKQRQLCFFSRIFRSQMRKTPSNTLETLAIARTKKTTSITTKMKKIWRNCLKDVLRCGYLQLKTICSINLFFFIHHLNDKLTEGGNFKENVLFKGVILKCVNELKTSKPILVIARD